MRLARTMRQRLFLSEADGIFTLKEEQRKAPKPFMSGKGVLALLPTDFGKSFVKHIAARHGAVTCI